MKGRRVVVTGMGMISPLGLSVQSTWDAILQGKSGVCPITAFDASTLPTRICAPVRDFDPTPYLEYKEIRNMDLFIQFGVAAAAQAVADAKLLVSEENASRIGVALGAGIGGLPIIETFGRMLGANEGKSRRISPHFIPGVIINMAPGIVSMKHGFKGPNLSLVSACTTGAHNIGYAARAIAYGDADAMVAGGTEMATTMLGVGGFSAARALSTRNDEPERASRPWDKDRDGFVLGEGAGVMVLEEYETAKRRGARIYAELLGFGMSADAYHMTAPDMEGRGAVAAMEHALADAELPPDAIQYINAHGTSTPAADHVEALAIKKAFGDHAYRLAVSSTKSMIGHLLGAAGAVEAIVSVLAIRDQVAPPTINLDNPAEDCDLDFVPHTARPMEIHNTLSNSFGFGGTNGTLLFGEIK